MSPSRGDHRLILASGSPRRRELLEMLGVPFGVIVPAVDETRKTSELPDRYVVRVARDKALAVARQEPGAVVLAADTAVVLRAEEVFGKPRSPEEAVAMLQRLEGRTHQVMSAVAVAQGERVEHAIDITDVTFRTLPERTIADYVATGEALDKAGAYAVQGRGAVLVEGIRGDFFGVMGLPLRLALQLLERLRVPHPLSRENRNLFVFPFYWESTPLNFRHQLIFYS